MSFVEVVPDVLQDVVSEAPAQMYNQANGIRPKSPSGSMGHGQLVAENWCNTKISIIKFNFLWKLDNFSFCAEEMGESKRSPFFNAGPNDKLKWCLSINPKGLDEESKDYLSIYLLLVQANSKNDKFIFKDYLLDEKNGLLPDDRLTILCEVSLVQDSKCSAGQTYMINNIKIPQATLCDDLSSMLENGLYSDCSLTIGSKVFKCHKALLATRSPVFKCMLQADMKEALENNIVIEDTCEEVIGELLRYIYSETIQNLETMADKLFIAADKYQIERLKSLCEVAMCNNLTCDNVCELFILADIYSAENLRAKCIEFINMHSVDVMVSSEWSEFIQTHPLLLAQVYKALADQQILPVMGGGPPKKRSRMNNSPF
uniref:BTB domain-containing protein n=1 Tax=Rhabditophanes sp. KR3021 TaxID=114890 RepID=A0AC35TSD1_9BILA